jgi:hypothetical protein
VLLSAAACANICAPANNRIGTSNRIWLNCPLVLISMVSLHFLKIFVPQILHTTFTGYIFYKTVSASGSNFAKRVRFTLGPLPILVHAISNCGEFRRWQFLYASACCGAVPGWKHSKSFGYLHFSDFGNFSARRVWDRIRPICPRPRPKITQNNSKPVCLRTMLLLLHAQSYFVSERPRSGPATASPPFC